MLFRELSGNSLVGIYLIQDGLIKYVNSRCTEIFGYELDEVADKLRVEEIIYPEDWPIVRQNILQKLSGETKTHHYEFRVIRKDKTLKHVEVYSSSTQYDGKAAIVGTIVDVTERKRAEEALRESEKKYRLLADNTVDVILVFDFNMNYRYVSPSVNRLRGFSPEEVVNQPIARSMPKTSMEMIGKVMAEEMALEKGGTADPNRTRTVEVELYCKDGSTVWTEVKTTALRNAKGEPEGIIGVARDITQRRTWEETLRESEIRLTQAMEMAHIVHWEQHPSEDVLIFNDRFYALYGTTAKQEGGYKMTKEEYTRRFVHPEDRQRLFDAVRQRASSFVHAQDLEHRIIRRDGEIRHVLVRTTSVKDNSGVLRKYGINQDITEQKLAEERIAQSEKRYRTLFENTGTAMIVLDSDTTITLCNTEFEHLSGYAKSEIEGRKKWSEFIAQDDVNRLISLHHLRRNNPGLAPKQFGFAFLKRTGERRDMYIVVDLIPDTQQIIASLIDITDYKRAELQRRQLEAQLYQAQKLEAIGTLAGGLAHDLNNMLSAVVGYATMLRKKVEQGSATDYIDKIMLASHKATDLVKNLLAFGRRQAITPRQLDLNGCVTGAEKLLRLLTKNIALDLQLADEAIIIMADPTQVDQILLNLATNSRDAMPHGGTLTITTGVEDINEELRQLHGFTKAGRYALLSVSDTGVGMDEQVRKKIFDPFFTTKEIGKGTGLGLSTVYGIVKQHDGCIQVNSAPGKGTTFNIYFPAVDHTGNRSMSEVVTKQS